MLNLKNNRKGWGNDMNTSSCIQCHGTPDDEKHLLEDCTKGPKEVG